MKTVKLLLFTFIMGLLIISCTQKKIETSNTANDIKQESINFVEGRITVVGNEPFSKLAIQINDSTTYILDCDSLTRKNLLGSQGEKFRIEYSEKIETYQGITLKIKSTNTIIDN